MKVHQAFWIIGVFAAWIFGCVYFITIFLTPPHLEALESISWLTPVVNTLTFGVLGYMLYRRSRTMLHTTLMRHPKAMLVWLVLWGGIVSVSTVRRPPDAITPLANWLLVVGLFVLVSSCAMLLLDENWHTHARPRWLLIATLSGCAALLVVIGL